MTLVILTPVKFTHNCTTAGVITSYFGDVLQYSTAMGEHGLKVWAKGMSQMALKQGIDKFTYSTSSCVGERMLLKTIANQLKMQNDKEQQKPIIQPCISKR
jgi:hypothetical protein